MFWIFRRVRDSALGSASVYPILFRLIGNIGRFLFGPRIAQTLLPQFVASRPRRRPVGRNPIVLRPMPSVKLPTGLQGFSQDVVITQVTHRRATLTRPALAGTLGRFSVGVSRCVCLCCCIDPHFSPISRLGKEQSGSVATGGPGRWCGSSCQRATIQEWTVY